MTLHPDIVTDLISLYHAGEASEATRALLEEEASRNPRTAAALAAIAPTTSPLPACPAPDERRVFRKVRLRYQAISFGIIWTLALLAVALLPHFLGSGAAVGIAITFMPLAILALFFAGGVGALYFFVRAVR